jgi:hypothetical protein
VGDWLRRGQRVAYFLGNRHATKFGKAVKKLSASRKWA